MRTLVALVIVVGYGVAWQAQGLTERKTVTGEVIDLVCYSRYHVTGMHHNRSLECAYACVKWEGQPVGVLTKDGQIYQLAGGLVANSNDKIAKFVAQTVTITGDVREQDGVQILTAEDVKASGTKQ